MWDQTTGGNQIQSVTLKQDGVAPTNRIETVATAGVPNSYHHPDQVATDTTIPINRTGRYVRVQLAGVNSLSLAEAQVLSPTGTNLSQGKTATQSSTAFSAPASRAVDGNTNGNFSAGSVTHTNNESQPYWEVDLGSSQSIGTIRLWNRTDCCSERLSNFYVFVSETPFSSTSLATILGQSAGAGYIYDAAGNVIDDGKHTYQYDAENRIKGIDIATSSPYYYAYDHQNRRIKTLVGATGAWTHSIWEGNQVIAEYSHTGALTAEYINAGSKIIAKRASGVIRYFLSDRLSTRVILDTTGNVVGRQGHLPFGEELGTSGEQDRHRFTSYERDNESGTDYAINRQYAVSVGRFLSVDRIAGDNTPQRFNRFAYTRNDPINRIDRLGLDDDPTGDDDPAGDDENAPCHRENPETHEWEEVPCNPITLNGSATPLDNTYLEDWSEFDDADPGPTILLGAPRNPSMFGPCDWVKSYTLRYDKGKKYKKQGKISAKEHIIKTHIRTDMFFDKSKYVFADETWNFERKFAAVVWLNAYIFDQGYKNAIAGPRGKWIIVYAVGAGAYVAGVAKMVVGKDVTNFNNWTNVATLILAPDCQTVETSHPGLPKGIDKNDPRIGGTKPQWWVHLP